jgi:hypothetical protein
MGIGIPQHKGQHLIRKPTIESGDANPGNLFDPALERLGCQTDEIEDLGFHRFTPVTLQNRASYWLFYTD